MAITLELVNSQVNISQGVGTFPATSVQCTGNGDGTINILNTRKTTATVFYYEVRSLPYAMLVQSDGVTPWGGTESQTVNNVNNVIVGGSGPAGLSPPVYTNPGTVQVIVNQPLSLTLTATGAPGVSWDLLPSGVVVDQANRLRIFGTPVDGLGIYNVGFELSNAVGSVRDNFDITVIADAGFLNTRSLRGDTNTYLTGTATTAHPLFRAGDGAGSGDAWGFSVWFYAQALSGTRTLLAFGDSANSVRVVYGGTNRRIEVSVGDTVGPTVTTVRTANSSITTDVWHHLLICYDGSSTANPAAVVAGSVFSLHLDGVLTPWSATAGIGYTGTVPAIDWHYGTNTLHTDGWLGDRVDEPALWASDVRAFAAEIYAAGLVVDINALATCPAPWAWHRFDGATYPTITDSSLAGDGGDLTIINGTAGQFSSNVP